MAKKLFSKALRDAINNAPQSRYAISKATGIAQANLSRLVHGTGGLSLTSLDKLCEFLELKLVEPKRPKKG